MDPVIRVLLKGYDHRFQEMLFHSRRYHRQIRYIKFYVTIVVSVSAFLFSNMFKLFDQLNVDSQLFDVSIGIFLSLAIIIGYYIFSTFLEALFMTYLNGGRLASLEENLNQAAGSELLSWDRKIIPNIYDISFIQIKGWFFPQYLVGVWSFLLFVFVAGILCLVSFFQDKTFFSYYFPVVFALTTFHIYQWISMLTIDIQNIAKQASKASKGALPSLIYPSENYTKHPKARYLIPASVFCFGFAPMVALSIIAGAYGLQSVYDFPLVTIPSVLFGDALVLPLFTYRFYVFWVDYAKNLKADSQIRFSKPVIFVSSLILSIIINVISNYFWVNDSYTGFMDHIEGTLSVAGWYHLIFSTIMMTLVIALALTALAIKKNSSAVKYSYKTWIIILIFSLFTIPDYLIRNFYVIQDKMSIVRFAKDLPSLITIIISLVIFVKLWRKVKKLSKSAEH